MDLEYLIFLQNIREATGGVMDGFMLFMTSLAETKATFLLLAFIYWIVDKRAGRFMGMNVSLSCAFSQMLKTVFHVERPWIRSADIHPVEEAIPAAGGYSFPSGHTTRAAATWGALGIYLVKDVRSCKFKLESIGAKTTNSVNGSVYEGSNKSIDESRESGSYGVRNGRGNIGKSFLKIEKNLKLLEKTLDYMERIIGFLMIALLFVIGFSRNYLGVHTPQDVIVALLYSIVMWYVSFKLLDFIDNSVNGDVVIFIVYAAITVLWMSFVGNVSNAGAGLAYLLSLILEKRIIHYKISQHMLAKVVTMILGGAGLILLIDNLTNIIYPMCGGYTGMGLSFAYMFYIMTIVPGLCMIMRRLFSLF